MIDKSLQSIQTEIIHESKIGKWKNGVIPHKQFISMYYLCRDDQINYMNMKKIMWLLFEKLFVLYA